MQEMGYRRGLENKEIGNHFIKFSGSGYSFKGGESTPIPVSKFALGF